MRTRLIALLSLCALALVACGGNDEDTYKEDFPPLSRDLVALGSEVGDSIEGASGLSDQQLADDFGSYAEQLGEIQQQIEELEPPDDLADDQDALVSAIGDVQGSLEDISAAAEDGDANAARDATVKLIEGSAELRDARRTLVREVREL